MIQFISRVLQPAERKWHIREKEALAIIYACETCRAYVIGYRFLVETDHKSLQWLLDAKSPPRLVRWALRLSEYDFEIRHKKGVLPNADVLIPMPMPFLGLYKHQQPLPTCMKTTKNICTSLGLWIQNRRDVTLSSTKG